MSSTISGNHEGETVTVEANNSKKKRRHRTKDTAEGKKQPDGDRPDGSARHERKHRHKKKNEANSARSDHDTETNGNETIQTENSSNEYAQSSENPIEHPHTKENSTKALQKTNLEQDLSTQEHTDNSGDENKITDANPESNEKCVSSSIEDKKEDISASSKLEEQAIDTTNDPIEKKEEKEPTGDIVIEDHVQEEGPAPDEKRSRKRSKKKTNEDKDSVPNPESDHQEEPKRKHKRRKTSEAVNPEKQEEKPESNDSQISDKDNDLPTSSPETPANSRRRKKRRRHRHVDGEEETPATETPQETSEQNDSPTPACMRRLPQSLPQSRAEMTGSLEIPEKHFSETQLEQALQRQMKGLGLPPDGMKLDVIRYAQDKSYQMLMQEKYDEAAKIDQAVDVIKTSIENDLSTERQETERSCVAARLSTTAQRERSITDEWNQRIADYRDQCALKMQEIQKRHEEEKRQFREEWARPEALIPYSKPSSELMHLKRQQQILAMGQDYEGAKHLKEQCDRLQEEESEASGKRASEAMKSQYLQLIARQEREISCFVDYGKQHIEVMEKSRNYELRQQENLKRRLQSILAANSPINRRGNVVVPRVHGQSQVLSPIAMQRRKQINTLRASPERPRLDVHLTDLNKLVKQNRNARFEPIKF